MHRKSRRLIVSVAWIVVTCATSMCGLAQEPDPARFEKEIAQFEAYDRKNTPPQGAILFVGSSTIRLWETAVAFPDYTIINRGFGGSQISDANPFANRIVLKYEPRIIVFYSGDNDVFFGKSPEQVFRDFQAFVALVRERLPTTRILFLSIKPSPARWKLWPQMQEVNERVEDLAGSDPRLTYVDTSALMLDSDGAPRKDLDDGLHLNADGYRAWNAILGPELEAPSRRAPDSSRHQGGAEPETASSF